MKGILVTLIFIGAVFKVSASQVMDSLSYAKQLVNDMIVQNHQSKKSGFKTTAYLKNNLVLTGNPHNFFGKLFNKYTKLNQNDIVWLNETLSDLYYTPDLGYKEVVKSSKSYGKYPSWKFNCAEQLQVDFTQNAVRFEALSDKTFISPLSRKAFKYYHFKHLRSEGSAIYLAVIPKHKHSPTFEGNLLVDGVTKKLISLKLTTTGRRGLDFIDSLTIDQQFDSYRSCPKSTKYSYSGGAADFYFSGESQAHFTDYSSISKMPDFFEDKELLKDDSSGFHQEILDLRRPLPLTAEEAAAYQQQSKTDENRHKKANIIDSLDQQKARQSLSNIFFKDIVVKSQNSKRAVIFQPIAPAFFYNTVEGFGVNYGLTIFRYINRNRYISITPKVRYSSANGEYNSDVSLSYLYNPNRRGLINFSGGSTYRDLNPNGTLSSLQNTINTLIFQQNFLKLYRKEYASLCIGREIINSLYFSGGLELSRNFSVDNASDIAFNDIKRKNFTSNNPLDPVNQTKLFPDHKALFFNASLIYSINQPFIIKNNEKIYHNPLGPRFIANYRKGIPGLFNSKSDYQFLSLEIQQEKLDLGIWGYGSYSVSLGRFYEVENVFYPEWKHFIGNSALVFNSSLKGFHFLDFYSFSTNQRFFEAHFEHNFNTLFSNKIPLLRKLKLEEIVGGAYLNQPQKGNFYEFYVGLRRLMVRADYAVAFNESGKINQGFKIAYNF